MAMPKKGVREVIVNGEIYRYVVKYSRTKSGVLPIKLAKVTIESLDKKYYKDQAELSCITPSYIRKLIEENL